MKYRKSKQRQKIYEFLSAKKHHPTANDIYDHIKKDFPSLSLGNVYRNLNILVETGMVKKIEAGSTFDRFEAVKTPHYHFVCKSCGEVIDIDMQIQSQLDDYVRNETGFNITGHRIDFYGICGKCGGK